MVDHSIESVSHDSDQHVQESDLGDDSRRNEEHVAKRGIYVILEAIHVEFSEHEKVLVDDWVNHEKLEDWLDDSAIIARICIQLKHVRRNADVDQDDRNDEANVSDISDRFCDQCDVKRRVVEKSQPIKYSFDSLANNNEGADVSLLNLDRFIKFKTVRDHDPNCSKVLEQVDPIVRRKKVPLFIL